MSFLNVALGAIGLLSAKKSSNMTPLPAYPEVSAEAKAWKDDAWAANDYMLNQAFSNLTGFDINEFDKIQKVNNITKSLKDIKEQAVWQMMNGIMRGSGSATPTGAVASVAGKPQAWQGLDPVTGQPIVKKPEQLTAGAATGGLGQNILPTEAVGDFINYIRTGVDESGRAFMNKANSDAVAALFAQGKYDEGFNLMKQVSAPLGQLVDQAKRNQMTFSTPDGKTMTATAEQVYGDPATNQAAAAFSQDYFAGAAKAYGMTDSELRSTMSDIGLWDPKTNKFYTSLEESSAAGVKPKTIQAYFAAQLDAVQDGRLEDVDKLNESIKRDFPKYYDEYYSPETGKWEQPDGSYTNLAKDIMVAFKDIKDPEGKSVIPERMQRFNDILEQQPGRIQSATDLAKAAIQTGQGTLLDAKTKASVTGDEAARDQQFAMQTASDANAYTMGPDALRDRMKGDDAMLAEQGALAGDPSKFDPSTDGRSDTTTGALEQMKDPKEKLQGASSDIRSGALGALQGQLTAEGNLFAPDKMLQQIDASRDVAKKNIEDAYLAQSNKLEETLASRGIVNSSEANLEREKLKKEALAGPIAQLMADTENQKQQLMFESQAQDVNKRTELGGTLAREGQTDIETAQDVQKFNITNGQDLLKFLADAGLQEQASILAADKARLDATMSRINALSTSGQDIRKSIADELGLNLEQANMVNNLAKTYSDIAGQKSKAGFESAGALAGIGKEQVAAGSALGNLGTSEAGAIKDMYGAATTGSALEIEADRANKQAAVNLIGMDNSNLSGALQTGANLYGMEAKEANNQYTAQSNAVSQQNVNKTAQTDAISGALKGLVSMSSSGGKSGAPESPSTAPTTPAATVPQRTRQVTPEKPKVEYGNGYTVYEKR